MRRIEMFCLSQNWKNSQKIRKSTERDHNFSGEETHKIHMLFKLEVDRK